MRREDELLFVQSGRGSTGFHLDTYGRFTVVVEPTGVVRADRPDGIVLHGAVGDRLDDASDDSATRTLGVEQVAVRDQREALLPWTHAVTLKWPNDLFVDNAKLGRGGGKAGGDGRPGEGRAGDFPPPD